MTSSLQKLADTIGILTSYTDACNQEHEIEDNVVRLLAEKLGYKAGNEEEIARSIELHYKKRWQKTLESISVVEQKDIWFDVVLPENHDTSDLKLRLRYRGNEESFEPGFCVFDEGGRYTIGHTVYKKVVVKINGRLEVGYYEIELETGGKKYKSVLAVAPEKCYANETLEKERLWGFAVQLYSLNSNRNWGIGDFTDLYGLVDICKRSGADVIGLNPLNVLSHDFPEDASPYGSVSRLFLNPIYIDVEKVPGFTPEDMASCRDKVAGLRDSELIQYTPVYELKITMLEKLYRRMLQDKKSPYYADYEAYCRRKGAELDKLALFQALSEERAHTVWGGWKAWEEEYRNSNSRAVAEYAKKHHERIGFFKYLQFEAERQFDAVKKHIDEQGLKIGLYRDLAVGVCQNSAELWGDYETFIKDAGAGAPPDELFCNGQNWGLGAFHPEVLKERAYEPYIKVLRANMHNAGALRIDHAMGLMRLFVILNQEECGSYVLYNFADMLNILAIESWLNRCTIVGESIGIVPEGFIEKMAEKNIGSLSVLWVERPLGSSDFKSPSEYPAKAFASVGTHDMPPLKMWWFGYEIAEKHKLGIYTEEQMNWCYHERELERRKLLFALDSNAVWPEDKPRRGDYLYGEAYPEGIEEAVHRFVARAPSEVFLSQLEDILHVEKMQNVPGIDRDQHPNWRRKLPVRLENLESDIAYVRNIAAIKKER
jgi:4-alpha-glucanotransferase